MTKATAPRKNARKSVQVIDPTYYGPTGISWENGAKEVAAITQKTWPGSALPGATQSQH